MSTRVSQEIRLSRSPAQVMDLLADPAFVAWRANANPRLRSHLVSHVVTAETIEIRTTAMLGADWLPRRVAAAVAALPTITRVETWHREQATGQSEFSDFGVPATARGTMRITPDGTGAVLAHEVTLAVDIPMVGALVERALSGRIGETVEAEAQLYEAGPPSAPA